MENKLEWLGFMCFSAMKLQYQETFKEDAWFPVLKPPSDNALTFSPAKGIGKYIALDFARRGARVILACRNQLAGGAAVQEIRELTNNQDVHLRPLDTSSLSSVREFATMINNDEKALHILVNNAGVSGPSWTTNRDHCSSFSSISHHYREG